jgi:hypothetical protein
MIIVIDMSQDNVSAAIRALREQGWKRSTVSDFDSTCVYYRKKDDARLSCAVGWLLPEHEAKHLANVHAPISALVGFEQPFSGGSGEQTSLLLKQKDKLNALAAFQVAHDGAYYGDMARRMQEWCKLYGYEFPEVEDAPEKEK